MIAKLLSKESATISAAALLLAVSMFGSRVLGLLRDRLLASQFGASQELDIYFAAFRIPDFVYGILIMGGFTAVFLPIFSEYFEKNREEAFRSASNVLNVLLVLLSGFAVLLFLLMPFLIHFVLPGFSAEAKDATVPLARLMLLSPILLGVSAVFSGMLQYFGRFLVYSLAPLLYNVGIIFGIVFFVPVMGLIGLAWGVVLGALLHLAIQVYPAFQKGFSWKRSLQFFHPAILQIAKLMVPRIVGAAAFHVNLVVITALASTLAVGSIAILNFANNLHFFPIGIIGISLATAAFPVLSRAAAQKDNMVFKEALLGTFRSIFFFAIPVASIMFLLRSHTIRLVLGTGEFGWVETRLTAAVLGAFVLGVVAQALVPLFARAFFALQNTKTPTVIGMLSIAGNILLALLFLWLFSFPNAFSGFIASFLDVADIADLRVIALPLAVSLAVSFQAFFLFLFLQLRIKGMDLKALTMALNKMGVAGLIMGGAGYLVLQLTYPLFLLDTFWSVALQASLVAFAGFAAYLLTVKIFRLPEYNTFLSLFLKK